MITLDSVTFQYKRTVPLMRSVDLKMPKGHIYGLLGKNGTGKSTLLKLMCGLLSAKKGRISVDGQDVKRRSPALLSDIYYLPEDYDLPNISVHSYVKRFGALYPNYSKDQFEANAQRLDIQIDSYIKSFSYGQKKKFLLAFGLSCNTSYLLLDEPTNGLDIPSKSQFRKLMAEQIEDDQTVVISTHQIRDLGNTLDHVMMLDQGSIIFHQSINNIIKTLVFRQDFDPNTNDGILYSELIPGGRMGISANSDGIESEADLELLFNAINEKGDTITSLFSQNQYHGV